MKTKMSYHRRFLSAIAATMFFVSVAHTAHAACETPGAAGIGGTAASGTISGSVQGLLNQGLKGIISVAVMVPHVMVQQELNDMKNEVFGRMNKFWDDWDKAWHDMSKQLGAGTLDQTRQLTSIADVANNQEPARNFQDTEYDAKVDSQPSVEGCGFDTTARYANSSAKRSSGLSSALANDIKKIGTNNKGTPAAQGAGSMQKSKWAEYVNTFCDPNANGGSSGCTSPGVLMNADIQPSKTIFGRDTINMEDANIRKAVAAVTTNVIGFKVPNPVAATELKAPTGKQKRNINREYLTQMDAVSALVTKAVAERSPGEPAPEIKAKRIANGIPACSSGASGPGACASDRPSEYEIRQSVIEEIRNPNYYVGLQDSSASTVQKEVLLQAYNVMLMYKILEKSSVIYNAYAIQTGNMLQRTKGTGDGGSRFSTVQPAAPGGTPP